MADPQGKEGEMVWTPEAVGKECKTWYKVFGDLQTGGKPPVLVLHGGPGGTHDYLLAFTELVTRSGNAVVLYDQIGNGLSTHLPETAGDGNLWQEGLFMHELNLLIDHLSLRGGYHLLGQSWGGMLGSAFAATNPPGLRRLVVANAPASMELWMQSAQTLKEQLTPEIQKAFNDAEAAGEFETPEYEAAVEVFYKKHLCRVEPWPAPEVAAVIRWLTEDPTVYGTMNGPSEMTITGTLKTWTVINRLKDIQVPTLVYNGEFDEAQDVCVKPYFEEIAKVKWVTFPNCSHFSHIEQKDKILKLVGEFLAADD